MLDLAFIRNHADIVKEAARVKNNTLDIDHLLEVDRQALTLQHQVEEMRAQQKQLSKRVQQAGKDKDLRDTLIIEGKQLSEQIKEMEPRLSALTEERQQLLYLVP
ncbi:MAG: serine--tRNA ligase, partial [Chloroflexota bacterium]|nr:serine--tRNA ligase [Chloroflexota bacterium]